MPDCKWKLRNSQSLTQLSIDRLEQKPQVFLGLAHLKIWAVVSCCSTQHFPNTPDTSLQSSYSPISSTSTTESAVRVLVRTSDKTVVNTSVRRCQRHRSPISEWRSRAKTVTSISGAAFMYKPLRAPVVNMNLFLMETSWINLLRSALGLERYLK